MADIIIRQGDKEYPRGLLDLPSPPKQLYARGNLELLTRPAVAVVGTRDCTRYGITAAKDIGRICAEHGICVVSGLAEGIDTAAHIGALEAQTLGGTIAVLGNGIDNYYPITNKDLQDKIAGVGLLLSEYPPAFRGDKSTFPQRNRIVAALSRAVVAVEADLKSGTFITVKLAKKIGRDVFAVPGNITSYASRGTNKLIADKTAKMLTSPDDIINYFGHKADDEEAPAIIQVTFEEKTILDILRTDEVHFDELVDKSGMPVSSLSTLLTNMEMAGLIEKLPGNTFAAV